jgi:arginyl-tRNA synthetase
MKNKIKNSIIAAIAKLQASNIIPIDQNYTVTVEHTKVKEHGDFTTNIALILANAIGMKPRALAEMIIAQIAPLAILDSIEIAGPGFINFFLNDGAFNAVIGEIFDQGSNFGKTNIGKGQKVNVEFVSANPTGPLHVGHGRGAAFGDTVANLLDAIGYHADREYYVNDSGRQMHILTASIWLRYLSLFDDLPNFPLNGYKGDYVIDIAKDLQAKHGRDFFRNINDVFQNLPEDSEQNKEIYIDALIDKAQKMLGERDYSLIFDVGTKTILADIRDDLSELGIHFTQWFHESSLFTSHAVQRGLDTLREKGYLYEKDNATWFKATLFGDEKDRVVIRNNRQTTYFASDIAYHLNKYERGYIKVIDILGSDHHGYAERIKAFLKALDLDLAKFQLLLVQFAILYRGKEKVQMSTRSGEFVTLRELREEVGKDAVRFFYIMRKNDQHLDFDLELAKTQSKDNPVYYIQYAHARICSVMRQLVEKNLQWNKDIGLQNLSLLQEAEEQNLIRRLNNYTETLTDAALNYAPHSLAHYLIELANELHVFYNAHKVLIADENLRNARLCLINAVRQILFNGLNLLGLSAPELM